jgi:hypothetical protein
MLVGLGKAWSAWRLHEDSLPYEVRPSEDHEQALFFHETLDVYRAGLDLVRWMAISNVSAELQGLEIPAVLGLANDKGLDEGCDEGPPAASSISRLQRQVTR